QLRRLGYKVSVGVMNGNEVDFVAQKADKTVYYQVAYLLQDPATIEREFGNLLAINDNYEKFVVSLDEMDFSDYRGIKHIKPWEIV
ncbi:MAG: ATP-binding protein, partial [Bacteroidales bacterium]|nr:ATP-binding protein [Bacteroidales bacterium]